MTQAIRRFDSTGRTYEDAFTIFLRNTNQKVRAKEWLSSFVEALPLRRVFVDAGAGNGVVTAWFTKDFARTVAIEPNPALFDALKATCPTAELVQKPVGEIHLGQVADLVLCSHVLYYIEEKQWLNVARSLVSWLSPTGSAVIFLQNAETDCMNMLRHFYGRAFSLVPLEKTLKLELGGNFHVERHTIASQIETGDFESAYRIAEFVLNLLPNEKQPSLPELQSYVGAKFLRSSGRYRMSCDQDILVIRRS